MDDSFNIYFYRPIYSSLSLHTMYLTDKLSLRGARNGGAAEVLGEVEQSFAFVTRKLPLLTFFGSLYNRSLFVCFL
jgi:hypothetical protein